MMQWWGLRKESKIFNAKKNIGENTNELVREKRKHNNKKIQNGRFYK